MIPGGQKFRIRRMLVRKTRAALHCTCELYNGCDDWWDLDNSRNQVCCNPSNNWVVFCRFFPRRKKNMKSLLETDGNVLSFLPPNLSPPLEVLSPGSWGQTGTPYNLPPPPIPPKQLSGPRGGGLSRRQWLHFFVKCNRGHGRCLICFQIRGKMEMWKRDDLETAALKLEGKTSGKSLRLRISKYKKAWQKKLAEV